MTKSYLKGNNLLIKGLLIAFHFDNFKHTSKLHTPYLLVGLVLQTGHNLSIESGHFEGHSLFLPHTSSGRTQINLNAQPLWQRRTLAEFTSQAQGAPRVSVPGMREGPCSWICSLAWRQDRGSSRLRLGPAEGALQVSTSPHLLPHPQPWKQTGVNRLLKTGFQYI